jgi:hypothetical protein
MEVIHFKYSQAWNFILRRSRISKPHLLFWVFIFQQFPKNKQNHLDWPSLSSGAPSLDPRKGKMFQVLSTNDFVSTQQIIYEEASTKYSVSFSSHLKNILPNCSMCKWQLSVSISFTWLSSLPSELLGKYVIFPKNSFRNLTPAIILCRYQTLIRTKVSELCWVLNVHHNEWIKKNILDWQISFSCS